MTKSLGMIALCIWLILYGILALTNVTFAFADVIMGVLAIVAGLLLLLQR